MKYFGEYLVSKNLISNEQLVNALIYQFKNVPTVAEIINNQKLMNPDDLLKIFKTQVEKKIGFIEAARGLGLWSIPISNQVDSIVNKNKKPLGEVLIELGFCKIEKITNALDDFLIESIDKNPKPETNEKNEKSINEIYHEISANSDSYISNLPAFIESIDKWKFLNTALTKNQMPNFATLIEMFVMIIDEIQKKKLSDLPTEAKNALKTVIDKLNQVFNEKISSETSFFANESFKNLFQETEDKMVMLKFELGIPLF